MSFIKLKLQLFPLYTPQRMGTPTAFRHWRKTVFRKLCHQKQTVNISQNARSFHKFILDYLAPCCPFYVSGVSSQGFHYVTSRIILGIYVSYVTPQFYTVETCHNCTMWMLDRLSIPSQFSIRLLNWFRSLHINVISIDISLEQTMSRGPYNIQLLPKVQYRLQCYSFGYNYLDCRMVVRETYHHLSLLPLHPLI